MKPIVRFRACDRRVLLSSLAMLPMLSSAARSTSVLARTRDPLPSWNEGPPRLRCLTLSRAVTTQGGPDFVPVDQRIRNLRQ